MNTTRIDSSYDPGEMDSELTSNNAITPARDVKFLTAASQLGFSYAKVINPTAGDIEDALCGRGSYLGSNFIIAEVLKNGHSHFVVITGEAMNPGHECDFTIADPSRANYVFLGEYLGVGMPTSIRILTKQ